MATKKTARTKNVSAVTKRIMQQLIDAAGLVTLDNGNDNVIIESELSGGELCLLLTCSDLTNRDARVVVAEGFGKTHLGALKNLKKNYMESLRAQLDTLKSI